MTFFLTSKFSNMQKDIRVQRIPSSGQTYQLGTIPSQPGLSHFVQLISTIGVTDPEPHISQDILSILQHLNEDGILNIVSTGDQNVKSTLRGRLEDFSTVIVKKVQRDYSMNISSCKIINAIFYLDNRTRPVSEELRSNQYLFYNPSSSHLRVFDNKPLGCKIPICLIITNR